MWKLHFATPDWLPGTEGCRFHCRCTQVTWQVEPHLYNIGRDPAERHRCDKHHICEPLSSLEEQQAVVRTIQEAVAEHTQTLHTDSVTDQYAVHRLIPRPWLQPCCNFPYCQCSEGD